MEKNINDLDLTELKAASYDTLVQIEQMKSIYNVLQNRILELSNENTAVDDTTKPVSNKRTKQEG